MAVKLQGIDEIFGASSGELVIGDQLTTNGPVLMNGVMRSQAKLCANGILDFSQSNYWVCNCSGSMTFSFTNVPTDADVVSIILELHNAGSHVLTFPSNLKWGGGAAPTFTANASDLVGFVTTDGGSTWRGMGLNFNAAISFHDPT